jgi:hypothetical protein
VAPLARSADEALRRGRHPLCRRRRACAVGVLSGILLTASVELCVARGWPNSSNYGFRRPDYLLQTRETKRPPSVHERPPVWIVAHQVRSSHLPPRNTKPREPKTQRLGFAETARATVTHEEHEFRCWWTVAGVYAATCGESSGGFTAPATGGRTGVAHCEI